MIHSEGTFTLVAQEDMSGLFLSLVVNLFEPKLLVWFPYFPQGISDLQPWGAEGQNLLNVSLESFTLLEKSQSATVTVNCAKTWQIEAGLKATLINQM